MKNSYKYELLAGEIENKIHSGVYQVGEKLPSIRNIQKAANLSMVTVVRAFEELENGGFVESKPKSGYYVKLPETLSLQQPIHKPFKSRPATISLDQVVTSILERRGDTTYLPLGSAIICYDLFPVKHFNRILKSFSTRDLGHLMHYGPLQGDLDLRRIIAQRVMGDFGATEPDDIVITNGCLEAVSVCLHALVKSGDTVAVESPTYFILLQTLQELGIKVVEVPTTPEEGFDVDVFEDIVKIIDIKACLLTPNINNPMGSLMPDEKKEKLAKIASLNNVPIIEDLIFSDLHYKHSQLSSIRHFDNQGLVLSCSSFSKTLSPGLRIGWIVTGKRFKDKILKIRAGLSISSPQLSQRLITEYLSGGGYERHLRILRQHLKQQTINTAIAVQNYFPEGTKLALPPGGYMLWVELPPRVDSLEFFNLAAKEMIFVIPGLICANSNRYKNYIRISCGFPFTDELRMGVKKLGEIAHHLA